jgi:polyhydroxyalkanoate synthesis regulator phasin
VPRILHEEHLIKSLVVESKLHHSPEAVVEYSEKMRQQNEQQRKFDMRIQKDIADIERRLGLKRQDPVSQVVAKFLNNKATTNNIDLLASHLKKGAGRINNASKNLSSVGQFSPTSEHPPTFSQSPNLTVI